MKIAIFHNYIGAIGGGEKLVLTLARGLGADVITTDVDEDSVKKMDFEDVNIIAGQSKCRRSNKVFINSKTNLGLWKQP